MIREMTAAITSVTQNACQTPTAPKSLLSQNAAGRMTTTYRQREISKEGVPFLKSGRVDMRNAYWDYNSLIRF